MASEDWLPILYAGFWDVPRVVGILLPTATIVLDSDFIETLDDYDPNYEVRVLPQMTAQEFLGSRTPGFKTAPVVGKIPATADLFDATRRVAFRRDPLDQLGLTDLIDAIGPESPD